MKAKVLLITLLVVFLGACGSKEGIKNAEHKGYLYFTGATSNAVVFIDGGTGFAVKSGADNLYGLKPGKHTVEVQKNGVTIVKREIYVGDGVSKEIEVK